MTIRPIKNEDDLALALGRIDELMDAKVNTPEADELDILSQLVELYEDKNWPIGLPSPAAAIEFRMEQSGLTQQDLEPYIGDSASVAAVLNGTRSLTLRMIRSLHQNLGIPADVLLGDSHAA